MANQEVGGYGNYYDQNYYGDAGDYYNEDEYYGDQYYDENGNYIDPNVSKGGNAQFNIYAGGDSDDDDDGDGGDGGDDDANVNINGNKPVKQKLVKPKDEKPMYELPKQPSVPEQLQAIIPNIKHDSETLEKHCGFTIRMNHNLVALACSLRTYHPKLNKNLQDTMFEKYFHEQYKKMIQEKIDLEKKLDELKKQNGKLQSKKTIVDDMQTELDELTVVSRNFGDLDKKYVKLIWKQNQKYRQELIKMGQNACNFNDILHKSKNDLETTQNNMQLISKQLESYKDEITSLNKHIKYLEENTEEVQKNKSENSEVKDDFEKKIKDANNTINKLKKDGIDIKKKNLELQTKIAELSEKIETGQSEKVAMKDQIQQHAQYQARQQMKQMEETLSKMTVEKIQMEDDFNSRMKIEQEKADKYRAKYESVKQHVKTLEMQKNEYTRVNMQLRQQNNQFRSMITQLQNQLRNQKGGGNNIANFIQKSDLLDDSNNNLDNDSNDGAIGPFAMMNAQRGRGNIIMRGGRGGPLQYRGRGRNGVMRGRGNNNSIQYRGRGGPGYNGYRGRGGPPPQFRGRGRGGSNIYMRGRGRGGPGGGISNNNSNGNGNNGAQGHQSSNSSQSMPGAINDDSNNKLIGSQSMEDSSNKPQRDLWGKRTKTISEKGNKKRVLVEWHFVTSDNQPHTVVLQHTQDNKPKTRRMLWVDGSEKYNNKSSASSFRIEIDKDVVVVSIDYVDSQYQYRLNINAMNYTEAFNLWKSRQKN